MAWDGLAMGVVLGAIPLAVLLTAITVFMYRWSVGRAMRDAASEAAPRPTTAPPVAPDGPLRIVATSLAVDPAIRPPLFDGARHAMRQASTAYLVAGLTHATVSTLLLFWLNDLGLRPFRFAMIWTVFAWPAVVALTMTAAATRRQRMTGVAAYFATLLVFEILAEGLGLRYRPGFGELFMIWALQMGAPTALVVVLGNRAWRSVGLIAFPFSLALVAALIVGFQLLGCLILTTRSDTLLGALYYLLAALVLAGGVVGWRLLRRAARRYHEKRLSDLMLTLDAWWMLVTAFQILFGLASAGAAAFSFALAFVAYRVVLGASLRRFRLADQARPAAGLLLLRVFGHAARVRRLTDQVGHSWRYAGPINMIAGTDLATAFLEPDELMAFWGGRLRQGFVVGPADLSARLAALDQRPDPDGRFRINQSFCHDNTWHASVHALAQRSAAVLMDLRGFGKTNRGCEFELGMLLDEVPLARVVLLIDRSTSLDDLEPLLQAAWSRLSAASPNRELADPELRLFTVDDTARALEPLLSRLFAAVPAPAPQSP